MKIFIHHIIVIAVVINKYEIIQQQEVKVIWQKAPHGGPIPRLGVTPGGRNCTIEFLG